MRKKAVWVEIAEKLGQSGECDNLYTYLNEKTFLLAIICPYESLFID